MKCLWGRNFKFFILLVITGFLVTSCFLSSKKEIKGNPLARVGDKYLFFDDVKEIIPKDITPEDSLSFLKNFINKWIKKQAVLEKAELTLSDRQKDVAKQLEEYRSVVLMNKFEQSIIGKQLDTNISITEIEEFYTKSKNELKLRENIVKPLFVRIPRNSSNAASVKTWYRSEKDADIDKLVKYTFKNKGEFFYEENEWFVFHDFFKKFPLNTGTSEEAYLKTNKYIEFKDSLDLYFLNIKDFKIKNEIAPLEFIKNEIKSIIINKRKINLIIEIENRLFAEALSDKHAEIFSLGIVNFNDTVNHKNHEKVKTKKQ